MKIVRQGLLAGLYSRGIVHDNDLLFVLLASIHNTTEDDIRARLIRGERINTDYSYYEAEIEGHTITVTKTETHQHVNCSCNAWSAHVSRSQNVPTQFRLVCEAIDAHLKGVKS